jgi:3-oxoacyl-[acyl-carrier protein] reductase
MTSSLDGHAAIVVGAAGSIGSSTARLLAARGVRVACLGRTREPLERIASELRESGTEAVVAVVDITDADKVSSAVERTIASFGQIHVLINCAAVPGPVGVASHRVALGDFDAVYRTNVRGAFVLSQAIIPHMLEYAYGRIAHVASIAGKDGNAEMAAYSTAKAALIGMVKAQGKEYAPKGIMINAVAPAAVRGPWVDDLPVSVMRALQSKIPMGRPAEPEEVAEMLCWMVSPGCSFTTGFTFDVSGGRATY